jgi:hypothetical protein
VIFTQRPQPTPAEVTAALLKPLDSGMTELEAARDYYRLNTSPDTKTYPFARYKEHEVCLELDKLFKRKCAYCETKYEAAAARDVEHFRPKGSVAKAPRHPGYWWLAAEWTNLLPSCPACNRRRGHIEYQPGMTLEEIELAEQARPKRTFGKGDTFPVRGDNWVTSEADDLLAEDPLLINPCVRDPQKHLEWVFGYDRQFAPWDASQVLPLVRPRQLPAGGEDPYGATSIAVYGLNRVGVFRSRMEHVNLVQKSCQTFAKSFIALASIPDADTSPAVLALRANFADSHKAMSEFMLPDKVYAGMSRAFIVEVRTRLAALAP